MSYNLQFILVMIILGAIIAWIIYSLVKKKGIANSACAGCSLSQSCKKRELTQRNLPAPKSCNDCPQQEDCTKRGSVFECGVFHDEKQKD